MGSHDVRYVVAIMPFAPEVKGNDFSVPAFKVESMMDFPAMENYKNAIDPGMPGMGNHGSPKKGGPDL